MATSHSGWGNCPAHKKNQLAMYPGSGISGRRYYQSYLLLACGMWQWVGWAVDRDPVVQARILGLLQRLHHILPARKGVALFLRN